MFQQLRNVGTKEITETVLVLLLTIGIVGHVSMTGVKSKQHHQHTKLGQSDRKFGITSRFFSFFWTTSLYNTYPARSG